MEKREELYSGKAKSVYKTDDPDLYVLQFRDDTSAFDGLRVEQLEDKGKVNNIFNAFIMEKLDEAGIKSHFVERISDTESVVKKLEMIPVECVVRNLAAGSICKRFGIKEGIEVNPPTFEFFLKNDELHDPMINDYHIASFGWADPAHIEKMKEITFRVNGVLKELFLQADMLLVDYKLEFGVYKGEILLGDDLIFFSYQRT